MSFEERIFSIVADVVAVSKDEISLESGIGDFPKWDSLGHMTIVRRVQDEFDIDIEPEELIEIEDVEDIVIIVNRKVEKE